MPKLKITAPPQLMNVLAVDGLYYDAACRAVEQAERCQKKIDVAEGRFARLGTREARILSKHEGNRWAAYDELEPIYIQMESAVYEIGVAYGPFLKNLAATHILAAGSLEAHVNVRAETYLQGKMWDTFERMSLEAKWLFLPKLLDKKGFDPGAQPFQGFSRLIKRRNDLVHYKPRREAWEYPGVPSFLAALGLTLEAANESVKAAKGMVRKLAQLLGDDAPDWLSGGEINFFELEPKI